MENAAKALLIAGGVLLAILILSLLVYMFSTMQNFSEAQETKTLVEQTLAFNAGYEVFNKTVMYGTDIITVINKAIDYNTRLGVDNGYITITLKTTTETYEIIQNLQEDLKSYLDSAKTTVFKCTGTKYDEVTGRIKSMTFELK